MELAARGPRTPGALKGGAVPASQLCRWLATTRGPDACERRWPLVVAGTCGLALGVLWLAFDRHTTSVHNGIALEVAERQPSLARLVAERPAALCPAPDLADCVGDLKALRDLITRTVPQWRVFKLQNVAHAFRLWGPSVVFDERRLPHRDGFQLHTPSGKELQDILLNDRIYSRNAPPGAEPILFRTRYGIGVRHNPGLFEGQLAHVDKLLRICAELGLPSSTALVLRQGGGTIRDIVTESMARIDERQELEWTGEGLARYLLPQARWDDRFGRPWSIDRIARLLLNKPRGAGPCFGTHGACVLMTLYRVDQEQAVLSAEVREQIRGYFRDVSRSLEYGQTGQGSYAWRWAPNVEEPRRARPEQAGNHPELAFGVAVTGHHLEWIALAPPDLRPSRRSIRRASAFLLETLASQPVNGQSPEYPAVTHAARALCLLVNQPAERILAEALDNVSLGVAAEPSPGAIR